LFLARCVFVFARFTGFAFLAAFVAFRALFAFAAALFVFPFAPALFTFLFAFGFHVCFRLGAGPGATAAPFDPGPACSLFGAATGMSFDGAGGARVVLGLRRRFAGVVRRGRRFSRHRCVLRAVAQVPAGRRRGRRWGGSLRLACGGCRGFGGGLLRRVMSRGRRDRAGEDQGT
jgi:hypothetical protein